MSVEDIIREKFKEGKAQQFHIEGDIWLVPCMADYMKNEFNPLSKPLPVEIKPGKKTSKGWTASEDEILLKIVNSRGQKAWSSIARELNALNHNGNPIRKGRHCRERWFNHVNPDLKRGEWTQEEDDFIIAQHKILGNRWSEISKKMQGRTENSVKNRFNSLTKKTKGDDDDEDEEPKSLADNRVIQTTSNQGEELNLLLFSPQLFNFSCVTSPVIPDKSEILHSIPIAMRSIDSKPPSLDKVLQTKSKLLSDIIESSFSPSSFFW